MIDIVSVNLNNKEGLERTIKSVLAQTCFDEINYIIIDGGSTDGSKEIIKKYKKYFGYSTSRQDKGIYNAMNKALSHLKGDYVLFLNSGDYLASETTIEEVLKYLDGTIIVYGDEILEGFKKVVDLGGVKIMVHSDRVETTVKRFPDKLTHKESPDKVDEGYLKTNSLPHQATFIKCEYQKEHPYNEDYKVVSDGLFFREAILKNKVSYKHIPITVSYFALDGISSSEEGRKEMSDYSKIIDK